MVEERVLLKVSRVDEGIVVDCSVTGPDDSVNLLKAIDNLKKVIIEKLSETEIEGIDKSISRLDIKELNTIKELSSSVLKLVKKMKSSDESDREQILKDINAIIEGR